jgi:hypothetical protein
MATLGVRYPVAVDDAYGTWNAYSNQYWPAEYLIDASGHVRHVSFGEGNYTTTESQIRQLLLDAHPGIKLPAPTDVPDTQPKFQTSPETYLGTDRLQYLDPSQVPSTTPSPYLMPGSLAFPSFGLGGTWSFSREGALAGPGATLRLAYSARDVYLVLAGSGSVTVSGPDGLSNITVRGIPTLYSVVRNPQPTTGILTLRFSPGIRAFDFTFG